MFGIGRKKEKLSANGRQSTELPRDEKPRGEVAPSKLDRSKKRSSASIFSGEALYNPTIRRHYPFAIYCCALTLLYMGYLFACQRIQREEISCKLELQKCRSKAMLIATERHRATSHDNIIKEIERRGMDIKQWNITPTVIRENNNEPTYQE